MQDLAWPSINIIIVVDARRPPVWVGSNQGVITTNIIIACIFIYLDIRCWINIKGPESKLVWKDSCEINLP